MQSRSQFFFTCALAEPTRGRDDTKTSAGLSGLGHGLGGLGSVSLAIWFSLAMLLGQFGRFRGRLSSRQRQFGRQRAIE